MSSLASDAPKAVNATSRPYLALGFTFLLLGVGFANPVALVKHFPAGMWEGNISREALNLYALTVFCGWAHFLYAWQGQLRSTRRMGAGQRWTYWGAVALMLVVLVAARQMAGVAIFSLVVWVWNISHFIKAEAMFAGQSRRRFRSPIVAFAWFTLVLFHVGPLNYAQHPLVVFAGTLALAGVAMLSGDGQALAKGELRLPLLTLFLLGETLVWAAYGPYMSEAFRVGVYVFHIGAASFFHYLSSYLYAQRGTATPTMLRPGVVLAINASVVLLGCLQDRIRWLWPLGFVIAPLWFTLWVALHLLASDMLPWWKRKASMEARP